MSLTSQKARWAGKAEKREAWAQAAEAKAASLLANCCNDPAFLSQPGHIAGRAAEIARTDRAFDLLNKARAHRETASNLSAMANRNAGDAERAREERRASTDWEVGDTASSIYGSRKVVKVNRKSLCIEGAFGPINIDKALCRRVAA